MKKQLYKKLCLGLTLSFFLLSCEDFLEVDAPEHKIVNEVVFNNNETALSAMTGIYHHLFRAVYSAGGGSSVTGLGDLSADNLKRINYNDLDYLEIEQNEISPENSKILLFWSSAYNMIYMCNSLLEGVASSEEISDQLQKTLEGEAKFIRAFTYFQLTNLFGEVPLLLTTDYRYNSLATRVGQEEIYQHILADLTGSLDLLEDEYRDGDRKYVNRFAAIALLARVHLYLENWQEAERLSSLVLNNPTYELKEDLDEVFLANSKEAIWQISPMGEGGNTNTREGNIFLSHPTFTFLATTYGLTDDLVGSFEEDDKRFSNWIGYDESADNNFAHKYKIYVSNDPIVEYSMVLRWAEQYLIRAEARARQGNISGAIADIDKIRERAGINLLSETFSQVDEGQIIELILEERRKELFTEWGHRWLDLKRMGIATEVLSTKKSSWEETDVLYPIPEEERLKNPNLGQNPGY